MTKSFNSLHKNDQKVKIYYIKLTKNANLQHENEQKFKFTTWKFKIAQIIALKWPKNQIYCLKIDEKLINIFCFVYKALAGSPAYPRVRFCLQLPSERAPFKFLSLKKLGGNKTKMIFDKVWHKEEILHYCGQVHSTADDSSRSHEYLIYEHIAIMVRIVAV